MNELLIFFSKLVMHLYEEGFPLKATNLMLRMERLPSCIEPLE